MSEQKPELKLHSIKELRLTVAIRDYSTGRIFKIQGCSVPQKSIFDLFGKKIPGA